MSTELYDLYGSKGIDLEKMKEVANSNAESIKFVIVKKESDGELVNVVDTINVDNISKENIEIALMSQSMFNSQKEALEHSRYLGLIDRVVAAAAKVNIADNNYKADFDNEDERKYVINYNQRTKSVSYDFAYTIMVGFTDFRLVFRTQIITENFINTFQTELKLINQHRVDFLKR